MLVNCAIVQAHVHLMHWKKITRVSVHSPSLPPSLSISLYLSLSLSLNTHTRTLTHAILAETHVRTKQAKMSRDISRHQSLHFTSYIYFNRKFHSFFFFFFCILFPSVFQFFFRLVLAEFFFFFFFFWSLIIDGRLPFFAGCKNDPLSWKHFTLKFKTFLPAAIFLFFTVTLQLRPEFEIESKSKYVV